jgi:hypothetical protein
LTAIAAEPGREHSAKQVSPSAKTAQPIRPKVVSHCSLGLPGTAWPFVGDAGRGSAYIDAGPRRCSGRKGVALQAVLLPLAPAGRSRGAFSRLAHAPPRRPGPSSATPTSGTDACWSVGAPSGSMSAPAFVTSRRRPRRSRVRKLRSPTVPLGLRQRTS